jgi:hypothetical protein
MTTTERIPSQAFSIGKIDFKIIQEQISCRLIVLASSVSHVWSFMAIPNGFSNVEATALTEEMGLKPRPSRTAFGLEMSGIPVVCAV